MLSSEAFFPLEGQLTLISPEGTKTVLASLEDLGWLMPGTEVSSEVLLQ